MSKDKFNNTIYHNYEIEFCLNNNKNQKNFSYSIFPKTIFSNKKIKDALFYNRKKYSFCNKKLLLSPKNSFRTLEIIHNNSSDISRNKLKNKELRSFPLIIIKNSESNNYNMNKIRLTKKEEQNQNFICLEKRKPLNLYFKNIHIKKPNLNEILSNLSNKTPKKKINTSKIFSSFKEKITSYDFNNSIIIKNLNLNQKNNQKTNKFYRLKSFNLKKEQNSFKNIKESPSSSNRNKTNNSIL